MAAIAPTPKLQFFTANGVPLAGGKLYSYAAGTTTPQATYTDSSGTTPNANPVVLDSRGEASVWLGSPLYKLVLTTATDVEVWTVDNVGGAVTLSQLAASGGSALVGFLQAGTNAAARTVQSKLRDVVSVRDFGAAGNGSDDDTFAMAAAHATGKLVYYPAGTYKFSRLTAGIASGGIVGDGQTQTVLLSTDTSGNNLMTFTGPSTGGIGNQLTFQNFQIQGVLSGSSPAKSGGAAIAISPASGENSYANFHNVTITFVPIGIDFVAASLWKVIGCDFLSYNVAGIQVANTNVGDSGDSVVMGCVFNNPYTIGSGIWQKSSGGLKILGNKFLGGARGYTMNLEDSTSVLIISGNSFENMAQQDIVFARNTAGKVFINVAITGNEFSVGGIAISTDATGFLSEVAIVGNQINMGAVGSNPCISLDSVTDFYVGNNLIKGNGGAGSSAISLNNCTNGKIGKNTYANLPNPLSITSSPTVTTELDQQAGTVTTANTGWAAYGTMYISPLQTVTFANAFLVAPTLKDVSITVTGASGEIGAIAVSVSKTQLTFYVISLNTSITAQAAWQVRGIL